MSDGLGRQPLHLVHHSLRLVRRADGLDRLGNQFVGSAEAQTLLADQGIGQLGDGQEAVIGGLAQAFHPHITLPHESGE